MDQSLSGPHWNVSPSRAGIFTNSVHWCNLQDLESCPPRSRCFLMFDEWMMDEQPCAWTCAGSSLSALLMHAISITILWCWHLISIPVLQMSQGSPREVNWLVQDCGRDRLKPRQSDSRIYLSVLSLFRACFHCWFFLSLHSIYFPTMFFQHITLFYQTSLNTKEAFLFCSF